MKKSHHPDGGYKSRKLFLAMLFGAMLFIGAFRLEHQILGELSMGLGFLFASYCGANGAVKILAARKGMAAVTEPPPPPKKKSEEEEDEEEQEGS